MQYDMLVHRERLDPPTAVVKVSLRRRTADRLINSLDNKGTVCDEGCAWTEQVHDLVCDILRLTHSLEQDRVQDTNFAQLCIHLV